MYTVYFAKVLEYARLTGCCQRVALSCFSPRLRPSDMVVSRMSLECKCLMMFP